MGREELSDCERSYGRSRTPSRCPQPCTLRLAEQMTYTRPRRRTILQASHMRFTADFTRMLAPLA